MNSLKRQKDRTLKDKLSRSVGANMLQEKSEDSSRRNEEAEPKWKQYPVVDVCGGKVKSDAVRNNTEVICHYLLQWTVFCQNMLP